MADKGTTYLKYCMIWMLNGHFLHKRNQCKLHHPCPYEIREDKWATVNAYSVGEARTWKLRCPWPSFELPILEAIWYTKGINLKDWTYKQIQIQSTYKTTKKMRGKVIQTRLIDCWSLTIYLFHCAKHAIYNIFSWRKTEPQGNNSKHLKAKLDKGNHVTRQYINWLHSV